MSVPPVAAFGRFQKFPNVRAGDPPVHESSADGADCPELSGANRARKVFDEDRLGGPRSRTAKTKHFTRPEPLLAAVPTLSQELLQLFAADQVRLTLGEYRQPLPHPIADRVLVNPQVVRSLLDSVGPMALDAPPVYAPRHVRRRSGSAREYPRHATR